MRTCGGHPLLILRSWTSQRTITRISTLGGETVSLADRFKLTIYDAAYLELALRRSLPLATLDDELRAAATALGLRLLGAD